MVEPTLETVLQRLSHVERQVRWWKGIGLLAMAMVGLVVLLGAAKGQEKTKADERAPVYANGNRYRAYQGSCGELQRLAYVAGVLDAFSIQVLEGPDLDLAAIVSRCLRGRYQSQLPLGQAHAITERYLQAHPESWDLSMPITISRVFSRICGRE
jgi:hypothetical protein